MMLGNDPAGGRPGPQVQGWIRQIRKEQAAGLDLATAAEEVRLSFEGLTGSNLSEAQQAAWRAAIDYIRAASADSVGLSSIAIRRPRRGDWYRGSAPDDANWPPMKAHLLVRQNWSEASAESLDASSTVVVSLMEDPSLLEFRGRGMVVGYVQSGKTANMLAVTAKAVDAGYRFVIYLAGMTNALRRQTQSRFESDLRAQNRYGWHLHTTLDDDGDFRTPPNQWFSVMDPAQVAVVKKNVTPLRRLVETISKTPPALRERIPVLVIDDECDQASVNASGSQYDTTAINGLIRHLLALLPRVQYVGYTATPFANVLINPRTPEGLPDDLYPEDFILALPRPDGYSGTDSLFGEEPADAQSETAAQTGADAIREIPLPERDAVRPSSSKERETFSASVPPSLDDALRYFIMATAARAVRGDAAKHNCMLVHTTVFTLAHTRLAEAIGIWLDRFGKDWIKPANREHLRQQWEREQSRVPPAAFGHTPIPFEEIAGHISSTVDELQIVIENSASDVRLDFSVTARKYIVIGGSVLSRGLTIEGLCVSYFVRTTSQYDTLLQMGRWFGFRRGYEDLPRIWMTADLSEAFRDLSIVETEIRADITQFAERGLTPADFAVRIRQIPGMTITAAKKMINAEACDVSFSGEHLQTIRFPYLDAARLRKNWLAGAGLLDDAGKVSIERRTQGRLVREVPLGLVRSFLEKYSASRQDQFSQELLSYVDAESKASDHPFKFWNVGVIEPQDGLPSTVSLGAFGNVKMVTRSRLNLPRTDGMADIKALMSRRDALLDVDGGPDGGDWASIKRYRQSIIGDKIPLLLLYAIDRNSSPSPGSQYRTELDAVADILGLGIVFPDRGELKRYVRVRLHDDDAAEDDIPEFAAVE